MKQYKIQKSEYRKWKKELNEKGMLFIYGNTGAGKTTQACSFVEKYYESYEYFSAKEGEFLEKIEGYLEIQKKSILVLDDIHLLKNQTEQVKLFKCLISQLHSDSVMPIILLSQGVFPVYLMSLRVMNLVAIISAEVLTLSTDVIKEQMREDGESWNLHRNEIDQAIEVSLLFSKGNPVAYRTFYQHWREHPSQSQLAKEKSQQDLCQYLDYFVFSTWEEEIQDIAMKLSAFPQLTEDAIFHVFQRNVPDLVNSLNQTYYFIQEKTEKEYVMDSVFRKFLNMKLANCQEKLQNELYMQLGEYYYHNREVELALFVYYKAKYWEKIVEIIIFMSENAEGCKFARISERYIEGIPEEYERGNVAFIGAKTMLFAYKMEVEQYEIYLEKLRVMADDSDLEIQKEAQYIYMRTLIASPVVSGQKLISNLKEIRRFSFRNQEVLRNIMPTGNYPSLVNGGIDLTDLVPYHNVYYPFLKHMMEARLGKEGYGVADGSMGEMYYEQNKVTKGLTYLTKALSEANLKGSLRVQYMATAVMARILVSQEKFDLARDSLECIRQKVISQQFNELLPNISASIVAIDLLKNDSYHIECWMKEYDIDEHQTFYITDRFLLFTKAKIYISQTSLMEALFILELLENYARKFKKSYFLAEVLIFQAMIRFRLTEPWEATLLEAVNLLENYYFVRIFADVGKALLPLWQEMNWDNQSPRKKKFIQEVEIELEKMANYYPLYLQVEQPISLSQKELEILTLVAEGYNNSEIAKQISVSVGTVKYHLGNINKKLEVENRTMAVKVAKERHFI